MTEIVLSNELKNISPGTCGSFEVDIRKAVARPRTTLTLIGPNRWQDGKDFAFHMNGYKTLGRVPAGFLEGSDISVEVAMTPFYRFFRFGTDGVIA